MNGNNPIAETLAKLDIYEISAISPVILRQAIIDQRSEIIRLKIKVKNLEAAKRRRVWDGEDFR